MFLSNGGSQGVQSPCRLSGTTEAESADIFYESWPVLCPVRSAVALTTARPVIRLCARRVFSHPFISVCDVRCVNFSWRFCCLLFYRDQDLTVVILLYSVEKCAES